MTSNVSQLPAYVQLRYRENGVFDQMQTSIRGATDNAEKQFSAAFSSINEQVRKSLSVDRNSVGALDLGVGDLKKAAAAQEARAVAAKEVATATRLAAQAEGDYTQSARLTIAATEALAREEREAAAAARNRADAAGQVQAQLDRQVSATTQVVAASSRYNASNGQIVKGSRAVQQATLQTGQQLQDIGVSLYSGQRAGIVFAQQLPQMAFALSGLADFANKTQAQIGRLGVFLSGPWGLAVGLATGVLASFVAELFNSETAAEASAGALNLAKEGADGLSNAQSALGNIFDLTSGKIKRQNELLTLNARLTAVNLRAEALAERSTSDKTLASTSTLSSGLSNTNLALGLFGIDVSGAGSRNTGVKDLVDRLRSGKVTREQALSESEDLDFKGLSITKTEFQQALIDQVSAKLKEETARLIDQTLDSGELAGALRNEAASATSRIKRTAQQALNDFVQELEARGQRVISTHRSAAKQNSLYKQGLTPLDGYNRLSRHQSHQAVDLDKRVFNEQAVREAAQAAGLKGLEIITESGGRKHAEFSGHGARGEVDVAGAERAARRAEQAAQAATRETTRLAAVSDNAAESVLRVGEAFDDQPRLIDRSTQAVRKMQAVIDELNAKNDKGELINKDAPRRAQLVAQAMEAQALAADAVNNELRRYGEATDRNVDILQLQAKGLYDQADLAREIAQLEEKTGLANRTRELETQLADQEAILAAEGLTAEAREQTSVALADTKRQLADVADSQAMQNGLAAERLDLERELQREVAGTQRDIAAQLNVLDTARGGLTDILSGRSTDLFGDLKQSLADLQGNRLFDDLFGSAFDTIEDQLRQNTPLGKATSALEKEVTGAAASTDALATATETAAQRVLNASQIMIDGVTGAPGAADASALPGAANDNTITITGNRNPVEIGQLSSQQIADKIAAGIVQPLLAGFEDTFGTGFMQQFSSVIEGALSGYIQGGKVGGVLGGAKGLVDEFGEGLFGRDTASMLSSNLGSALGGAATGNQINGIASALGLNLSGTGSQIGGAIGSFLPIPGGDIIGAVAGGIIGKLFGKAKRGSAIIGGGGELGVLGFFGNNSANKEVAGGLAGSAIDFINRIAERLNANVNAAAGKVSIGIRDGNYRVDPQGRGYTKTSKYKDILDFGEDAEAAVAAATKNLIEDGVITGLRASTNRLLRAGDDLETALQDALDFEDVFTRLQRHKDPVGAALDSLDREFTRLTGLFDKAGASAEEYAQLEELYGIERAAAVKQAAERVTGTLRDLLNELTVGDSGLSLRTRQSNALAEYNPLAERVAAGDVTAYDDFAEAARALLEIERQLYGSQQDYFTRLDEVTTLTRERIDSETNIASIAANRDIPFDQDGRAVDAIMDQTGQVVGELRLINQNLIRAFGSAGFTDGGGRPLDVQRFANF